MNQNFRSTTGIRNLKLLAKSKDLRKKNNVDYDITEYMNNYNTIKNKRIIEEIDKYDSDEENENTEITGDIQEINEFKLIDKLTIESIDSQNDNNLFISNDSTFSSNNLQMIKYKNGFIYVGLTKNDLAKGIGKLYHHNSIVYKGFFDLNQFCDYGVYKNEVATLLEKWGEGGFKKEKIESVLKDIIYLTETARERLLKLEKN